MPVTAEDLMSGAEGACREVCILFIHRFRSLINRLLYKVHTMLREGAD